MNFLVKVISIAVIVGGSIVYALNESVPKQYVNNIDIFIIDKYYFIEILLYLQDNFLIDRLEYIDSSHYFENNEDIDNSISII